MTETDQRVLNGRYRIETLIGRGGMADVYRAHDLSLQRPVAVKMLRPDLARDPQFITRFKREAQSSASLNHPSIVGVYDTGQATVDSNGGVETPFIIMEHVEGVTLRHILHGSPNTEADQTAAPPPPPHESGTGDSDDVLALSDQIPSEEDQPTQAIAPPLQEKIDHALGKPLDEVEAVGYMSGILAALGYSHERGIVHRDIKPSNVMVSNHGAVKVMDFGIARAVADSANTMTQTASVVGTAQYLSPEQARGEIVDHRSDLYSAGCLLFELLTNRPPFVGESPVSVAYQHVKEQPPAVSEFNARVTPAMESVVAKSLAKDPVLRFQDAGEFHHALQNALQGIPVDDYDATGVMPAVAAAGAGAGANRSFDDLVGSSAPALSARTPEDPDIDDYADYGYGEGRRRRGLLLPILSAVLLVGLIAAGVYLLTQLGGGDPEEIAVPEVEGMTRSEALDELSEATLRPQIENQAHEEIDADHAIGTDPEAGQMVEEDSQVTLYISEGAESVTIPEGLVGSDEATVTAELESLGLEVGEVTEEDDPSASAEEVLAVSPEEGTEVQAGSSVSLTVSTGEVQLPSGLVGEWREPVEAALTDAGISWELNWVILDEPDDYFAGQVIELEVNGQSVDDGGSVPNDATVTLNTVSGESWPEPEEEDEEDEDEEPDEDDSDEDNGNGNGNGNGNDDNGNNGNNGNGNGNGNNGNGDEDDEE
ncbi:protein kinase domain-containing protein [Nesterenkonia populi]|uniref:protein kinase domain-containing protein n=1 Tax=Nesterenkonia populi TaxID=1591087 RepID=UPI00147982BF|nr:protein kinase [Nesterenkonia populi]